MKTRLASACMNHIGLLGPARDELPCAILEDFDCLHQMMTTNGEIKETIDAMTRDDAMKLAGVVVSLAFRLTEEYIRQQT